MKGYMTTDTIKVMTALQLRKAVKDAGHDPMGPEFAKGDPDTMRAFLYALYEPPQIGMESAAVAFAALQEEHEIAEPPLYGAEAISAARNSPPVLPMSSASYEQFKSNREVPMTVVNKNFDDRITTLELRVATLEQMLKISNVSTVATPAQPDQYSALAPYLHATDDGPELVLTVSQVPALTLEQKFLVLQLFGELPDLTTPPRVLNQRIVTVLQRTK